MALYLEERLRRTSSQETPGCWASRGRRRRRKARPPAPVVGHPQTCSAESVRDVGWVSGEERGGEWWLVGVSHPYLCWDRRDANRERASGRGRAPPPPPASHCTAATLVRRGLMVLVGEIEMKTLDFTCLNDWIQHSSYLLGWTPTRQWAASRRVK
jgi:hypothetical protein